MLPPNVTSSPFLDHESHQPGTMLSFPQQYTANMLSRNMIMHAGTLRGTSMSMLS